MFGTARPLLAGVLTASVLVGCGNVEDATITGSEQRTAASFGAAPEVPEGELSPDIEDALEVLVSSAATGAGLDAQALDAVAASDDARLGWILSDLLRFAPPGADEEAIVAAFERLSRVDIGAPGTAPRDNPWLVITDRMIAWDLPAPPGYRQLKSRIFLAVEPAWEPFFADGDSAIDWRLVSWGGVFIDDREPGAKRPCPRGCIPALDDPKLTSAAKGDWYPDDRTVFGVVVGGEAVALPKNIMEVHEMVNLTVGDRRLGTPYCTLCGSAQAYFTDSVPDGLERPVLRTSGLLSRSNKVMYDLRSESVLDTFTGEAISGPLHDAGVTLDQASVVASTWKAWKRDHPETLIVAEDGGIGRRYPLDPLGGRDDDGPIFPVGDVDPRLPVQTEVVGAITAGGEAVAFPVEQAHAALDRGQPVKLGGAEALADGDGLRVVSSSGDEIPSHQAFWFAWSQFHPKTGLWSAATSGG